MQQDLFDTDPNLEAAGQDAVRAARAFLTAFKAADAPSREVCAGVWESFAAVANAIKPLIAGRVNHQQAQPGAARTSRAAPDKARSHIPESRKLCRTKGRMQSKYTNTCPVCGDKFKGPVRSGGEIVTKGDWVELVSPQGGDGPSKWAHPECTVFCPECDESGGYGACSRRPDRT